MICCHSVTKLCPTHCHLMDHSMPGFPVLLFPRVCSNSCPLSQSCHPTISFSAMLFSSCPQFFPASGSFPMSWLFASRGQSTGASASTPVLPKSIQGWFPLRLTGLSSLLSKTLSKVLSNNTVQKHQFFSTQPSLQSNSHIHMWLLESPYLWSYSGLISFRID